MKEARPSAALAEHWLAQVNIPRERLADVLDLVLATDSDAGRARYCIHFIRHRSSTHVEWRAILDWAERQGGEPLAMVRRSIAREPAACDHPDLFSRLRDCADPVVLARLCAPASGPRFKQLFRALALLDSLAAGRVLDSARPEQVEGLNADDVAPLLKAVDARPRLVAIAALGRLQGASSRGPAPTRRART